VHATDPEVRRACLRNPDAPDVMEQLRWLSEHGIETHTQLVVTPGLNDGPHLERSVRDLATLWLGVRSVSVVPVGLTKHHKYSHRPNTTEEARAVLDACHAWQREYRQRFGVGFVYPTDEWYLRTGQPIPPREAYDGLALQENGLGMVRDFLDDWVGVGTSLHETEPRVQSLTLATGALFAPTLEGAARELADAAGVQIEVVPVENRRLGETITVAGLLMAEDVIAALQTRDLGERLVLPRIMFDHPETISLDDVSPDGVATALGRPVYLADTMRDVLAALVE
jgi:putative radical SAM enzyme (TIGR03279 family)